MGRATNRLMTRMSIEDRQFKSEMQAMASRMDGFGTSAERNAKRTNRAFGGISFQKLLYGTVGLYAMKRGIEEVGGAFIDAASKSENYKVRLNSTLRSQSESNRMFDEMVRYASRVPHTFESVIESATSLSGVMAGGVDEVKRYMPIIGDLAAVTGLSIQESTGQVIRMYSAGAATADLFRERGVLAMLGFKAGVSYTAEETRKKLIESWESSTSKIRGATDELAKNWDGKVSMMHDKWFRFRTALMQTGAFDALKVGLDNVNAGMDVMVDRMDEVVKRQKAIKILEDQGSKSESSTYISTMYGPMALSTKQYTPSQINHAMIDISLQEQTNTILNEEYERNKQIQKEEAETKKKRLEENGRQIRNLTDMLGFIEHRNKNKYITTGNGLSLPGMFPGSGLTDTGDPKLGFHSVDQRTQSQEYLDQLAAIRGQGQELQIRMTTEGYQQERALLKLHYEQQYGMMAANDERRIAAERNLQMELSMIRDDGMWGDAARNMQNSFFRAFDNIEGRAVTFKNVFRSMAVDITRMFSDMAVNAVMESIQNNGAVKGVQ